MISADNATSLQGLSMEHLSDVSDIATVHELTSNHINLQKKIQAFKTRPLHPDFDGVHCVDCGDPIVANRLKEVRTDRCTDCATIQESRGKLIAKAA